MADAPPPINNPADLTSPADNKRFPGEPDTPINNKRYPSDEKGSFDMDPLIEETEVVRPISAGPKKGTGNFQPGVSLIRKESLYSEIAKRERTGRKLQFVDQIESGMESLTTTSYVENLHYAPVRRGNDYVEVKHSGNCCAVS